MYIIFVSSSSLRGELVVIFVKTFSCSLYYYTFFVFGSCHLCHMEFCFGADERERRIKEFWVSSLKYIYGLVTRPSFVEQCENSHQYHFLFDSNLKRHFHVIFLSACFFFLDSSFHVFILLSCSLISDGFALHEMR